MEQDKLVNDTNKCVDPIIMEAQSFEERLCFVFENLVSRFNTFKKYEKNLLALEESIFNSELPEDYWQKLELYERFCKIHINYADSLRKMACQIDLNSLTKAAGISALFLQFKELPKESIIKIQKLLLKMRSGEDVEV